MANGQNDHSFHRPTNSTLENTLLSLSAKIIGLIQFSCKCAILDKEKLRSKLVVLQLFCVQ